MRSWQRLLLGGLLLVAVAVAGIALNFTLLDLIEDENDPVGKLSPRAVFTDGAKQTTPVATVSTPAPTATTAPVPDSDDSTPPGSDDTPRSDDDGGDDGGDDD